MKLSDLLKQANVSARPSGEAEITGLTYDSRTAGKGDLFFAMKGVHADGHDFLGAVGKQGAAAAVVEKDVAAAMPVVKVSSVLSAMAPISDAFFGFPSKKIPVIGITGTNGKTTTTYLIEGVLKALGKSCGVMGTINYRLGSDVTPAPNTTPMSMDVQRFLMRAIEKKAALVAMEVSSHALELNRVDNVRFAVGVFTNLTQDHLDFHKTMEAYYQAKRKLFTRDEKPKAVVNVDDEYGVRLAKEVNAEVRYGLSESANLRATNVKCDLNGLKFKLTFPSGNEHDIANNLLGFHNVSNCLSAAGAMLAFGLPESDIVRGLNQKHSIPGRLERVEAGQKFVVAVDYAHTHDALAQVLTTLRNTGPKRLVCVFGAGGDRDKTKRPKMGDVAVRLSDQAFVTSDNPRSETPSEIMKDIEAGIKAAGKNNYTLIEDREQAIKTAIESAGVGDIVLIAGKGHEDYQIYKDKRIHFSDVEMARKYLSK